MTQVQPATTAQDTPSKPKPANGYRIIDTTGRCFNAATTDIIRR